jgi:hypothetical protein
MRLVRIRRPTEPSKLAVIDSEVSDDETVEHLPTWAAPIRVEVVGTFADLGRGYQWFEGDDWTTEVRKPMRRRYSCWPT